MHANVVVRISAGFASGHNALANRPPAGFASSSSSDRALYAPPSASAGRSCRSMPCRRSGEAARPVAQPSGGSHAAPGSHAAQLRAGLQRRRSSKKTHAVCRCAIGHCGQFGIKHNEAELAAPPLTD